MKGWSLQKSGQEGVVTEMGEALQACIGESVQKRGGGDFGMVGKGGRGGDYPPKFRLPSTGPSTLSWPHLFLPEEIKFKIGNSAGCLRGPCEIAAHRCRHIIDASMTHIPLLGREYSQRSLSLPAVDLILLSLSQTHAFLSFSAMSG
eukprot:767076-Hanusia_phi.AAC.11